MYHVRYANANQLKIFVIMVNENIYWLPQNIFGFFSKNGLTFEKMGLFYIFAARFVRLLIKNRVTDNLNRK